VLKALGEFFTEESGEPQHEDGAVGETRGAVKSLSANSTGDVNIIALSASLQKVTDKLAAIEAQQTAATTASQEAEVARLVACFTAEGKSPLAADGKPLDAASLTKLSSDNLKLLLANTPVTVPLSARIPAREGKHIDPSLKGRDRLAAAFKTQSH
jgi:hypothetical protein